MHIELKVIDGQPFIVTRSGKKEFVRTVAEQVAVYEKKIRDCRASADDANYRASLARQAIEVALLSGESCTAHRAELAAAEELATRFTNDGREANRAIKQIFALVDAHAAAAITHTDAEHLAALTAPYDLILKVTAQ